MANKLPNRRVKGVRGTPVHGAVDEAGKSIDSAVRGGAGLTTDISNAANSALSKANANISSFLDFGKGGREKKAAAAAKKHSNAKLLAAAQRKDRAKRASVRAAESVKKQTKANRAKPSAPLGRVKPIIRKAKKTTTQRKAAKPRSTRTNLAKVSAKIAKRNPGLSVADRRAKGRAILNKRGTGRGDS